MCFKDFTDRLLSLNITTADIAKRLGVTQTTVLRWRMDPENPNARAAPSPERWEAALRDLARDRAATLEAFAKGEGE